MSLYPHGTDSLHRALSLTTHWPPGHGPGCIRLMCTSTTRALMARGSPGVHTDYCTDCRTRVAATQCLDSRDWCVRVCAWRACVSRGAKRCTHRHWPHPPRCAALRAALSCRNCPSCRGAAAASPPAPSRPRCSAGPWNACASLSNGNPPWSYRTASGSRAARRWPGRRARVRAVTRRPGQGVAFGLEGARLSGAPAPWDPSAQP